MFVAAACSLRTCSVDGSTPLCVGGNDWRPSGWGPVRPCTPPVAQLTPPFASDPF